MFPDDDDECERTDSTTAASAAAAAVRSPQPSLHRFSDEDDDENSQPPLLLCPDQAHSEGVAGNQAGQAGTGETEGKKEGRSCGGFRHRDPESEAAYRGEFAHDDDASGAEGVDGEDDETDEELAEGTCGTPLEEEDVETDEEVGPRTWDRKKDRRQPQEEDGEADSDGVGKGVNNRADDVVGFSPPPVNEMPSENGQQIEPKGEIESAEHQKKDNEENPRSSSVEEEERTRGAGAGAVQGDFAPPSPLLRVPPMIQVLLRGVCFLERWRGGGKLKAASDLSYFLLH